MQQKCRAAGLIELIKDIYGKEKIIPLHRPCLGGEEKALLSDCIESTFVSSVGPFVSSLEEKLKTVTGSKFAVATVNGTAALHLALIGCGLSEGKDVITQALTFVGSANAIAYTGAKPVFLDIDEDSLSLSPTALQSYLQKNALTRDDHTYNKFTGREIAAVVVVDTFGMPARTRALAQITKEWNLKLIEDAAEALGSLESGVHVGSNAHCSVISFNGNKIVTTGGGGCVLTNQPEVAEKIRHISTTAKVSHDWEFFHDQLGFNFRMPNINAAVGLAQLRKLDLFLEKKREVAKIYKNFCTTNDITFINEPSYGVSNFWLNAVLMKSSQQKLNFLNLANNHGIMARPAWTPLNRLPHFSSCETDELRLTDYIYDRLVNLPSSVPLTD